MLLSIHFSFLHFYIFHDVSDIFPPAISRPSPLGRSPGNGEHSRIPHAAAPRLENPTPNNLITSFPLLSALFSPVHFSRLSLVPFLFPLHHRISLSDVANVSCCTTEVGKTRKGKGKSRSDVIIERKQDYGSETPEGEGEVREKVWKTGNEKNGEKKTKGIGWRLNGEEQHKDGCNRR
jgi:hypothetical protein